MSAPVNLKSELVDVSTVGLRLAAAELASGVRGGAHRAIRKGAGVEFAGHRPYTPGDDLRHLDRHSLLRHGRLMVREFYTDTERTVHVLIDATTSMRYVGPDGTRALESGVRARSKLQSAALFASALSVLARGAGDPIGLTVLGEDLPNRGSITLPARAGVEAEQRFIATLEEVLADDVREEGAFAEGQPLPVSAKDGLWRSTLERLAHILPSGSSLFVFSDFFDFAHPASPGMELAADAEGSLSPRLLADLSTRRRSVTCVQVLDPSEVDFPFTGAVRLIDEESGLDVETDASVARDQYLENLARLTEELRDVLAGSGATFLRSVTSASPLQSLREILLPR